MNQPYERTAYIGDDKGTRYEVYTASACPLKWTLVVCEDRPGLYSTLLKDLVSDNVISKAITVPFCQASIALLKDGRATIHGKQLDIANLDQCVLVLDMDGAEGICDLPGIDETTRAYAGAEFYRGLPQRIQVKTYLASRLTPFKPDSHYFERYRELAKVVAHPHFREKEASVAMPELSDEAKAMITHYLKAQQMDELGPTFKPFFVTVFAGKNKPKANEVRLCVSYEGSQPFSPDSGEDARYVFTCLCYPGKHLDTAKLYSAVKPPAATDAPAIDASEMVGGGGTDGGSISECRGDETLDTEADTKAIHDYVATLQNKLDDVVSAFAASGKPVNQESSIGQKGFLKLWCSADSAVGVLRKQIEKTGAALCVRHKANKWKIAVKSRRQSKGGTKYKASKTIRKAVDRWLHDEVEPHHPTLYAHLRDNIKKSDGSKTIYYCGDLVWNLGDADFPWRIPLKQIEAQ